MAIAVFVAWTVVCAWIVFGDGAETLERWKASLLVEWWAGLLSAPQLRVYVALSWIASAVGFGWSRLHGA